MNITLFSQILQQLSRKDFQSSVKTYQTDKYNKGINSWTYLVSMIFLHLAKSNSIKEVTNRLKLITSNLNHLGITEKTPSKSSLSYINAHRDWRVFRDFYFKLKNNLQSRGFLNRKIFNEIDKKIYLLDTTVISLCEKNTFNKYPKKLRRTALFDEINNRTLEFITNNFFGQHPL
ncbi:MAG: hypothetical protein CR986_03915 [Ignavibacteriae bacterium]|nr:MAG: hypothetical protein CR986_03915 [Ignavibacteriota bacterium]